MQAPPFPAADPEPTAALSRTRPARRWPGAAVRRLGIALVALVWRRGGCRKRLDSFFTCSSPRSCTQRRVERTRASLIRPAAEQAAVESARAGLARQARGPAAVERCEEPGAGGLEVEQPGELGPEVTLLDRLGVLEGDAARAQALLLEHASSFSKSPLTLLRSQAFGETTSRAPARAPALGRRRPRRAHAEPGPAGPLPWA